MNVVETLLARNTRFAADHFDATSKIMPKLRTLIVGCVDPRVDPAEILGLEQGEVAVLRNIGGRITPDILLQLDLLRKLGQALGGDLAAGFNLVVLHHTDCGIRRMDGVSDLDTFLGEPQNHVHDPRGSVTHDIELLRAHRSIDSAVSVSGLVYDVTTGTIDVVVPTALLRA